METLHIVLFLVGVVLCVAAIAIVNGRIFAKKRKKTKLGLVKVAGAGLELGNDEEPGDAEAGDNAADAANDPAAPADPGVIAPSDNACADSAGDTDGDPADTVPPAADAEPIDYVDVSVNEEAVETMAMPLSAVINGKSSDSGKVSVAEDYSFAGAFENGEFAANDSVDAAYNGESPYCDKPPNDKKAPPVKKRLPETVKMKDRMVLLVEDVEVNRELVSMFFEDTGVKLDFAENGLTAYEKFEKNPTGYSLILMDIQMPGIDGYATAKKIRAMEVDWAKQIPIIAMTANVFKDDIDACFDAGMDDHVAKPLDMEVLRDKVFEFMTVNAE